MSDNNSECKLVLRWLGKQQPCPAVNHADHIIKSPQIRDREDNREEREELRGYEPQHRLVLITIQQTSRAV